MIGRWQAWRLRRMTGRDLAFAIGLLVLAAFSVSLGRKARSSLTPRSAIANAQTLNDLELPPRLPNAPLVDPAGASTPILDRMKNSRAVVAFYAPWCGPCQEELPSLVRELGKNAELFVVVGADEDLEHTKRQLGNIGLSKVVVYVDSTGALAKEGRVTVLPTTFAISKRGAVLARTKGYSFMGLYQLTRKVRGAAEDEE